MALFGINGNSKGKTTEKQKNVHTVAKKETLYSISKKYGISVDELREYNGIGKDNAINTGQTLRIPPRKGDSSVSVMPKPKPETKPDNEYTILPDEDAEYEVPQEVTKSPKEIAQRLKKLANKVAAVGKNDFTETLMQINKDNVVDVIKSYDNISKNESLIEMICDEWGSSDEDRKAAVNHIMDTLSEKVGKKIATDEVRNEFTTELNDQFDSWGWVSTKKLDKIINNVISDYEDTHAKEVQAAKDKRTVRIGNKKTTSGRLRLDADSTALREDRPDGRPDPVLDKNGRITANIKTYNPIGHGDLSGKTIIINAGHGGYNPNNGFFDAGSANTDNKGNMVEEWSTNDALVKKLIPLLSLNGAKVIYMNGSAINIMNAKEKYNADMFVSIHCDSASNDEASGQRVIYRDNNKNNSRLAQLIEKNLEKNPDIDKETCITKQDDRGLGVLKSSPSIPSVLIETGFLSNEDDIQKLQDEGFQYVFASNLAKGISDYFKTSSDTESNSIKTAAARPKVKSKRQDKNPHTIAPQTHTVQKGETLYSLERKYGLRAGELASINGFDANKGLSIGQKIKIPERFKTGNPQNSADVAKLLGFSKQFVEDLKDFEGKEDVHKVFYDKVGNATIGYGHLINTNFEKKYYKNRKLSDAEVYNLLAQDLLKAENAIRQSIGSDIYEDLSQKQKQALVDFVFSRGAGTFNSDACEDLRDALIDGDMDVAAANITYNRSIKSGEVMNGLTKRRLYEMAMFAGNNKSDIVLDSARELFEEGLKSAKKEKLNQGTIDAYKRDVNEWFDGEIL